MKKLLGLCILGMALPTFGQVVMSSNWSSGYDSTQRELVIKNQYQDGGCRVGNSCGYAYGDGTSNNPWQIANYNDLKKITQINTDEDVDNNINLEMARGHFKLISDINIDEVHSPITGHVFEDMVFNIELSGLKTDTIENEKKAYQINFNKGMSTRTILPGEYQNDINVRLGLFAGLRESFVSDVIINANFTDGVNPKPVKVPFIEPIDLGDTIYSMGILAGYSEDTSVEKIAISTVNFKMIMDDAWVDTRSIPVSIGGVFGNVSDKKDTKFKDISFSGDINYKADNSQKNAPHQNIAMGGIFATTSYESGSHSIENVSYNGDIVINHKTKSENTEGTQIVAGGIIGVVVNISVNNTVNFMKNAQSIGTIKIGTEQENVECRYLEVLVAGIIGSYPIGSANVSNVISKMDISSNLKNINNIDEDNTWWGTLDLLAAGIIARLDEATLLNTVYLGQITSNVDSHDYFIAKSSIGITINPASSQIDNSKNFTLHRYAIVEQVTPDNINSVAKYDDPDFVGAGTLKTMAEFNADNGKLWADYGFNIADGNGEWVYMEEQSGLFVPYLIHTHSSEYIPTPKPGPTPNPDPNSWGFNKFWVIPGILVLMAAGVFIYMKKGNKKKVN